MIIWSMMAAQMVVQGLPHQPFMIFGVIVQLIMKHFSKNFHLSVRAKLFFLFFCQNVSK